MNYSKSLALLAPIFASMLSGVTAAETLQQVRLVAPLDEPEFYCLDLSGWGDHLKLDDPLQAHTCKTRRADDQLFAIKDGKILVGETDRCLQVAVSSGKALAGSAAAGDESTDASGPSHVWRVLSVERCDSVSAELMTWQIGL